MTRIVQLDPGYRAMLQDQVYYLHNITDLDWPTGGRMYPCPTIIPGKAEGQRYSTTPIHSAFYNTQDTLDERIERAVGAKDCALDLEASINGNIGGGAFTGFNGVFSSPNETPTEEELSGAEQRLRTFYEMMVKEGDKTWQQYHKMEFISGQMIRAAEFLKIERDWCMKIKPQGECPACGSLVKPGVAICKECHAILDVEKAEKYGLVQRVEPEKQEVHTHKK